MATPRLRNKKPNSNFLIVLLVLLVILGISLYYQDSEILPANHLLEAPDSGGHSPSDAFHLLNPRRTLHAGRELIWQLPPDTSSTCPVGLLFMYHGCQRLSASFFYSPQGREIVAMALSAGMGVVAFPKEQEKLCWKFDKDMTPTIEAEESWLRAHFPPICANKVPIFGFGASSGANFLAELTRKNHYHRFSAVYIEIMAPHGVTVPTYITIMSEDSSMKNGVQILQSTLNREGLPNRLVETKPKPIPPDYFARRFAHDDEMTDQISQSIYNDLKAMNVLGPDDYMVVDPRRVNLDTILLKNHLERPFGVSSKVLSILKPQELSDASQLWLREELNVAYDMHEITSEGFQDVLQFFMEQAQPTNLFPE